MNIWDSIKKEEKRNLNPNNHRYLQFQQLFKPNLRPQKIMLCTKVLTHQIQIWPRRSLIRILWESQESSNPEKSKIGMTYKTSFMKIVKKTSISGEQKKLVRWKRKIQLQNNSLNWNQFILTRLRKSLIFWAGFTESDSSHVIHNNIFREFYTITQIWRLIINQ